MFLVVAQKRYMYGDEVEIGEFDYDNPVGIYDSVEAATEHARAHASNHGVAAMVIRGEDKEMLQETLETSRESPEINCWNTKNGSLN